MSEAGKDADARTESAADQVQLTVVQLTAVQPKHSKQSTRPHGGVGAQGVQLAKDHALLGQSMWCGIVFALAVVITVVNLLPPSPVGYRVTSQVLVSPARLHSLEKHLKRSQTENQPATLLQVRLLDSTSSSTARTVADQQILVEVGSLWTRRTSAGQVQRWLGELSEVQVENIAQLDAGRIQRFARWEVQTRQHYLNQHRQHMLARQSQAKSSGSDDLASQATSPEATRKSAYADVQLGNPAASPPLRFATLGDNKLKVSAASTVTATTPQSSALPQTNAVSDAEALAGNLVADQAELERDGEIEQRLLQALNEAQKRHADVDAEIALQASQLAGSLTLPRPPSVRAVAMRLPANQVVSMLVLALACGAVGGWANHRAQSGGTFRASEVGANMALLGLPVLGRMQLPGVDSLGIDGQVKRQLDDWRRWSVQQTLNLSELVVLGWCMVIVVRLAWDPLWRALLLENPLSALARMLTGLP